MTFKIDKGIPIPTRGGYEHEGIAATLRALDIGESFLIPVQSQRRISPQIAAVQKRTGREFVCRKQSDGIRVWRVA